MADHPSFDEPGGCSESAALVQQVLTGSDPQAWGRLEALYVRPLAKRVAMRLFANQARADFLDEASAHVFKRLSQFDRDKACFKAWCYSVLKNLATDMGKARKHRREVVFSNLKAGVGQSSQQIRGSAGGLAGPLGHNLGEAEMARPLDELFGFDGKLVPWQVDILKGMPPLRRVIAVAAAGLVGRVAPDLWAQWCQEAEVEGPFPPAEIYEVDEPTKRLPLLARALGMRNAAVRQHWYRALPDFRKLVGDSESGHG